VAASRTGVEAYQRLTTDLVTPDLMRRWFPDLVSDEATRELIELLPDDPFADGGGALMRADRDILLAWDLLPKMDIATMANSLEARSPLLDTELVAFAAAIPPEVVIGRRQTKPLLRALAKRHLPPDIVTAPKRGFEVPVDRWLAGPLRPLLESTVLIPESRVAVMGTRSELLRLLGGEISGAENRAQIAWALLILGLFLSSAESSRTTGAR
jgi:hypothetical protein